MKTKNFSKANINFKKRTEQKFYKHHVCRQINIHITNNMFTTKTLQTPYDLFEDCTCSKMFKFFRRQITKYYDAINPFAKLQTRLGILIGGYKH